MDETPYRLAYESSVRAIDDQARVLEGLRARTGTVLAVAALVTTFLGQETLTRSGDLEPLSLAGLAICFFALTAVAAFVILWPFRMRFSVSAAEMLRIADEREGEALREIALRLGVMYDLNAIRVQAAYWCPAALFSS